MRKGQKNSSETIEKMRLAANRRWASGIYTPEVWQRMGKTYRQTYRTRPWKNPMTDPAIAAKVVAARRANGSYYVSPEKREKLRRSMFEQFASGRRVSPFADPAIRQKSLQTMIKLGHLPWNHSPEALASRAEKMRRHFAEGRMIPPMHYPGARKKRSLQQRGQPKSKEHRQAVSDGMKRAHTEGRAALGWRYMGHPSKAERTIARRLRKIGFIPQMPFLVDRTVRYRIDFAHPTAKLAIEIDGTSHLTSWQKAKDKVRDKQLRSRGWSVLRMSEVDTLTDPRKAVHRITIALQKRHL